MIYDVKHTTTYHYRDAVSFSHHVLRLSPRALTYQRTLEHLVKIDPVPAVTAPHTDYFGNAVAFVAIEGAHHQLSITGQSRVSVLPPPVREPAETPAWETVRELSRGEQIGAALDASEFIFNSPMINGSDELADYAAPSFPKERPILESVLHLTDRIHRDFKFDPRATTVATPLEEVFKHRRGVCQDFAHLQIGCLRSLGLPARYVSGYLETVPPPGRARLAGADASHAWISFYSHGLGWIDVDPTNNHMPSTRHITLAWGRDFSDVSPIRGVIHGSGDHSLSVAVDVIPVEKDELSPDKTPPGSMSQSQSQ